MFLVPGQPRLLKEQTLVSLGEISLGFGVYVFQSLEMSLVRWPCFGEQSKHALPIMYCQLGLTGNFKDALFYYKERILL